MLRFPLVDAYADNHKSLVLVSLIQVDKMGDGFPAGGAPGCPEVEENGFPSQAGKGDLLTVERLQRETGRRPKPLLLFSTTRKKEKNPLAQTENETPSEKRISR